MDKEILSTEKVWWIQIRNIPFQMVFLIPYMKTFVSSAPALETLGSPDVYSVSDTFYTPSMNKTFGDRLGPNKDIGNNVFFCQFPQRWNKLKQFLGMGQNDQPSILYQEYINMISIL